MLYMHVVPNKCTHGYNLDRDMYKGPTRQALGPFVKKYYTGYIIIMLICIQGKRADIVFVIWALPMNGIP